MANKAMLCISSIETVEDSITGYLNIYEDIEIFEEDPAEIGEVYMIDTNKQERV